MIEDVIERKLWMMKMHYRDKKENEQNKNNVQMKNIDWGF